MSNQLTLPTMYEDVKRELGSSGESYVAKLMEFVRPVESVESQLAEISAQMGKGSGRVVLLLGEPGSGKSTFIESLAWRQHLPFSHLEEIDCESMPLDDVMNELVREIQRVCSKYRNSESNTQFIAVAINYLEHLEGQDDKDIRSFFRSLNGILRKNPLFIIWPVTNENDALKMIEYATSVSGTIFHSGKEILDFKGPSPDYYEEIAKNTISVLNDGLTIEDFNLTNADLTNAKANILNESSEPTTIRRYLEEVKSKWQETNDVLQKIHNKIPKPTEVWFVFSYPEAETVVSRFARRGDNVESAWKAFHDKLYEYIPDSQRAADWTPKRLQLAIGGTLTTRIMYLTTNSLVSSVASSIDNSVLDLTELIDQPRWFKPSAAKEYISTTPVIRQLRQEPSPSGKRKGGPAATAREDARPAFEKIVDWTSGSGNDRHVNRAIASIIERALPSGFSVRAEKQHP